MCERLQAEIVYKALILKELQQKRGGAEQGSALLQKLVMSEVVCADIVSVLKNRRQDTNLIENKISVTEYNIFPGRETIF